MAKSATTASKNKKRPSKGNKTENNGSKKRTRENDEKGDVKKPALQQGKGKKKEDSQKTKPDEKDIWSKSKKKRMRRLLAKMKQNGEEAKNETTPSSSKKESEPKQVDSATPSDPKQKKDEEPVTAKKGSTPLHQAYAARLTGSRFRILNEELYTTTSNTAFENFQSNPELFDQYHEGFRHQVGSWPSNPVDIILQWLTKKYVKSSQTIVVADFGCGDAELAKRLLKVKESSEKKKKKSIQVDPFRVHSFDLVAKSDLVTACDMANVPIPDKSVDVGIFCLALMGTNVADFLIEAHRVLKDDGIVKIAEVRSRFESSAGKDDLDEFLKKLKLLGFECVKLDRSNKMFVMMDLKKNGKVPDKKLELTIKPCIYKRR